MTDDLVLVDGLTKSYGPVRALDGLDLRVTRGEIHGFLGPNGAGKTTTIRILLGLVRATGGMVRVVGADPWTDASQVHERLGHVPGDVSLWPGLTGGQCIDVLGSAQGGLDESRRAELVERFDLDPTRRARDYSKGNRQKVALVAALASRADVLVLDEPTSGLDPLMEQVFQDVLRARRADGCTVLLSSHILAEVEALADRVTIIRRGRTVTTGTLADLRRHTRTSVHAVTREVPLGLSGAPGVADAVSEAVDGGIDSRLTVDADRLDDVVGRLHDAGIRALTVRPPSLDALFLERYEEVA
ncbi:ABC transporter related [Nostocoides japonicum T1-X7]|uniref:ABC transporter related n=1 Tax=Nostocoides japonicum T1-X7 TaxID=1194083 RepID=A0A077LYC2_9MICO|nr:ABC transporter ATP-binding protein [Tetrasphaera japonica]CCH78646.1 ABC transporter related [Tetrasphaera japonica T1-X7]